MVTVLSVLRPSAWFAAALLAVGAASPVAGEEQATAREFDERPAIRVVGASTRFRLEGGDGVEMWLDGETLGVLALADALADVPTSIVPARLPLPDIGSEGGPGTLTAEWSPTEQRLYVRMGALPLLTVQLPEGGMPRRILLRHLDRLALLILRPNGGPAIWGWTGFLRFVILIPDAEQYLLCALNEVRFGDRRVDKSALLNGIPLSRLDEAGDVIVVGRSPAGEPFQHRHRIRAAELDERVYRALGTLSRTLKLDTAAGRSDR